MEGNTMQRMMLGKVESYSDSKGWGFIRGDDGRRYYVSRGGINKQSIPSGSLYAGCTVEFRTGEGNRVHNVGYYK